MTDHGMGLVFLSHWSGNAEVVHRLQQHLDRSSSFLDVKSMNPGHVNLRSMQESIKAASVFVFVVSPKTPLDCFAFFEASHAELIQSQSPDLAILVWPIEGASYKNCPEWMQRYFAIPATYTVSDVAREIRSAALNALTKSEILPVEIYEGREDVERKILVNWTLHVAQKNIATNAIVLSGLPGMGRTSLARHLPPRIFPAMRNVVPEFDLQDSADALDLYVALISDIEGSLSLNRVADLRRAFPADSQKQADLIAECLSHWGDINQAVIIKMRWGLRDGSGQLQPWFQSLLNSLKKFPSVRAIFVSGRKLTPESIARFDNVMHQEVPELSAETILYLLTKLVDKKFFSPTLFPKLAELSTAHPATVHHVAQLINNGRAPDTLLAKPHAIFAFQDGILGSVLSEDFLAKLDIELLQVLCWFPGLDFPILKNIFSEIPKGELSEALWRLADLCLLDQAQQGTYRLPNLARSTLTRRMPLIKENLQDKIATTLKSLVQSDTLLPEQIEPLILAYTSTEADLPKFLSDAITSGTLANIVERHYERGRSSGDKEELVRSFTTAAKLAELALALNVPADTMEHALMLGADAMARLGKDPEPICDKMAKRGFISAFYARASYKFHKLRDYNGAIADLRKTLNAGRFKRRSIRMLARIYLRIGDASRALDILETLSPSELLRDSGFLSMKIRALNALKRFPEAKKLEVNLAALDDDYGEALIFGAAKALRQNDYPLARELVDKALGKPRANLPTLKFLRCVIDLNERNDSSLAEACHLAETIGRTDDAHQLRARAALLLDQDWARAEEQISMVTHRTWMDYNLELEILVYKEKDKVISRNAAELDTLRKRKEEILRRISSSVEFST